ncbi:MAG: DinB family protein [Fimbriimonadaceae bacterium]|nr:DinB family protein [Fimbriimonadaceae bacterium]
MIHNSPTHQFLKGRLAVVRQDLVEAVDRLTDDMLEWAPAKGMRTIGGQLQEIAATELQEHALLKQLSNPNYDDAFRRAKRNSVEEYRRLLLEVRNETIALIDGWSEDDLNERVPVPTNWFEGLGQDDVPRAEIIRSLAAHEWYHTGQLVSYLWTRGDDPYKW